MSRRDTALRFFSNQSEELKLRAKSGIELYRKGNADITIRTADGSPLPENITVEAEQVNHEFRFGANIFMLDEFECEEKNVIYRKKFAELFNLATLPFYWSDLEPEQDKPRFAADSPKRYRRPPTDLCVDYCREKGVEPKCHCLNYDSFVPSWVVDKTVEEHKALLDKRFRQITEMTIPAYSDKAEDEEIQAELIRGVYTTFFSHEAMEAVIYWNLVDGYAHNAKPGDFSGGENLYYGGLLRFDMSEKPAYKTLYNLIHKEWHTSEKIKAQNGKASFRGFYGDYKLNVIADGKTVPADFTLSKNSNSRITVVI